jgi:transposase
VERWAELRREHFVRGVSIKELARRTGLSRNTVRLALRSERPPHYERTAAPSKLDPFKEEVHELLRRDPKLPGVRVRELIEPLGFRGGKTIVDDYLREVRPLFAAPRTFQRTVYRPGEICQWDLWETSEHVPVGHGQLRRAWVVVACMGFSRAGAGALIFSKEAPDVLWGMARCLWSLGALPQMLVWDREGCLHAGGGRPTETYAGFCGQLPVDWYFCEAKDPQAKGVVERLQEYLESNFEPGRQFANHLDFQLQLDAWFEKANGRGHRTIRARPVDRLIGEHEVMRALPSSRRIPTAGGSRGCRRTRICASTPTTTRSTPGSWGAAWKFASASERSPRLPWIAGSWRAATSAASPSTARSPDSSTPGC